MDIAPAVAPEDSFALPATLLWAFYELRACAVGAVTVGLFLAALYFLYYLVRLSRLPLDSREYKQQSHLLAPEALLRYIVVIASILLLNVLFGLYF